MAILICKRRRILSQTGMSGENPLRIYKEDQDPVYKDSAVEAFLDLTPEMDRGKIFI